MKVLIDTNIVLDLLLEREPFIEDAIQLFEQIEIGKLKGYIAATTITNIFYIIRKAEGREIAEKAIHQILAGLELCEVNRAVVETALTHNLKDFEDGIQLACATLNHLDIVVTRDLKDFAGANFSVCSIKELLTRLF
jgi:predicted nucleic acid-binding protein